MGQTAKERVLEKMIGKLKENANHSQEFLNNGGLEQIGKKMDNLLQDIRGMMEKEGKDEETKPGLHRILNSLESIHESYMYYTDATVRATKDYGMYVYVLETLYNEYSGNLMVAAKALKEVSNHTPKPAEEKRSDHHQPAPESAPKEKPKVAPEVAEEKPKQKTGRFKWGL